MTVNCACCVLRAATHVRNDYRTCKYKRGEARSLNPSEAVGVRQGWNNILMQQLAVISLCLNFSPEMPLAHIRMCNELTDE